MGIFAKAAKGSIYNTVREKFKKFEKTSTKTSKYDDLKNEIKRLCKQLANAYHSGGGKDKNSCCIGCNGKTTCNRGDKERGRRLCIFCKTIHKEFMENACWSKEENYDNAQSGGRRSILRNNTEEKILAHGYPG